MWYLQQTCSFHASSVALVLKNGGDFWGKGPCILKRIRCSIKSLVIDLPVGGEHQSILIILLVSLKVSNSKEVFAKQTVVFLHVWEMGATCRTFFLYWRCIQDYVRTWWGPLRAVWTVHSFLLHCFTKTYSEASQSKPRLPTLLLTYQTYSIHSFHLYLSQYTP